MIINQINYNGQKPYINVIMQEESQISKCSFLDNETIEEHETYLGRRIKEEYLNLQMTHCSMQICRLHTV
jgi:hypothetical protein